MKVPLSAARTKAYFPNGVATEFAKLHFECAQAFAHPNIDTLRALVPDSRILFGSDFPGFPLEHAVDEFKAAKLPPAVHKMVARDNGAALLPRWA